SALVTLDPVAITAWAKEHGLGAAPLPTLASHPDVRQLVRRGVDEMNASLPKFATVKRFTILPEEFSEAAGEVTPSQKLKRKVIEQRYAATLDAMYAERAGARAAR
ncbi:MAG: long-chain fatty acid--CoA ligase, partial [Anaeromyxobacteraceae bacterium]